MNINELITQLTELYDQYGNLEVLITDGFECAGYRGNFQLQHYIDIDGESYIDIGIGGLKE